MHRRRYLAVCSAAVLAGCSSSDSDSGGGGGATTPDTETPPASATATDQPTPTDMVTETQTAAPAAFTVESITGPDTVSVGETHQIEITVRNTGGVEGTYRPTIRFTTSQTTEWDETEIEIGPIAPGDTETLTSDEISFEMAQEVTYEIAGTNAGHTYTVTAPQAGLEIGRSGLVEVDLGYDTTQMAEIAATNTGDAIAGQASMTVDWYNDAGEYLASTTVTTRGLHPGETWLARADPGVDVDTDAAIADFEVSPGQARPGTGFGPEGVTISNAQHRASDQDVIVRATVQNTRDTELDYLAFVGKVYNDADEVIGHYYTNELDIKAGATLRFEGNPRTNGRNGQVTDHEVLVSTATL